MMKHNNKWVHGNVKLVIPQLPAGFMVNAGIYYLSTILDKDVGEEIVLIIFDPTDFIYEISAVKPFQFHTSSVAINTSFGPVVSYLFYVPNPINDTKPFVIFDKPIDISIPQSLEPWIKLAGQTHLHLLLVDKNYEVQEFFEFDNDFGFDRGIETIRQLNADKVVDFTKAKQEYFNKYSLLDLYSIVRKNGK